MGELSFLTIIVSLAVCSLLIYAVFQYMKVRLTILEQSHKEQALILQQFIEESSTDIHRLYQMKTSNFAQNEGEHHGSIILEYANENNREYNEKPVAYDGPHIIHLDTAMFQNKRTSNLIEISSDSEDTTENEESTSEDETSSSSSNDDNDDHHDSDSEDDTRDDNDDNHDNHEDIPKENDTNNKDTTISDIIEECVSVTETPENASEFKMITVDLGTPHETNSPASHEKQQHSLVVDANVNVSTEFSSTSTATYPPISGMSVTELRFILKEKHKQQPEKHAEIQKMKKAELIQALQSIL